MQEIGAVDHGVCLIERLQMERLTVSINGEKYSGERVLGAETFTVSNSAGKTLTAVVAEHPVEEWGHIDYERFSHLHGPVGILDADGKQMIFREAQNDETYEKLENVLFGGPFYMVQRILLSLSLAAAAAEAEEVFSKIPMQQLRLDAFYVNKKDFSVKILSEMLAEQRSETERDNEYRKMARLGLMPPEWYEDPAGNPATLEGFRHFLAVLIFRALCASDPFDGSYTIEQYPYMGETVLKNLYGKDAEYILVSEKNKANSYAGAIASTVLGKICPRLKKLFEQAFVEGVRHPESRPSAAQWLENQKNMMNWYDSDGKDWRIPDLESGEGVRTDIDYLCLSNGIVLPVYQKKLVYQYMFQESGTPCDEKVTGVIKKGDRGLEIQWKKEGAPPVLLNRYGMEIRIQDIAGEVRRYPRERYMDGKVSAVSRKWLIPEKKS